MNIKVVFNPKQVHIKCQESLSLKLIFKRIMLSTNYQVQKVQCKPSFTTKNNIATLNHVVEFTFNNEADLNNSKIVMILMSIRGRQINFIGNGTLQLSNYVPKLAVQTKVKIQKCIDPNSYLLLSIRFEDLSKSGNHFSVPETSSGQNTLQTESFYKQQANKKKIKGSELPTAYEISRRNYKNSQILRQDKSRQKEGSKSGSYKKRFEYQSQSKNQNKMVIKNSNYKVFPKRTNLCPAPRQKTPQPIIINSPLKNTKKNNNLQEVQKQKNIKNKNYQEPNYQSISQKLQFIQDKISSREKGDQSFDKFSHLKLSQLRNKHRQINSFQNTDEKYKEPKHFISQQQSQSSEYSQGKNSSVDNFLNVSNNQQIQQQKVSQNYQNQIQILKTKIKELELENKKLKKHQDQIEENLVKIEIINSQHQRQAETQQLKIHELQNVILQLREQNLKKQNLVQKITKIYESQSNQRQLTNPLKVKLKQLEEQNSRLKEKLKILQTKNQNKMMFNVADSQSQQLSQKNEEMQNLKKKCLNLESSLKHKENELKINKLKMDNLCHEKESLEQQIDMITKNKKYELTKKNSIAKINLSSQNLTNSLKVQNQALRSQILILQEQLQNLNALLDGSKSKFQNQKLGSLNSQKLKALQIRLQAYEDQLRQKKLQFADIINIIWAKGSSELVSEVATKIGLD